MNFEHISTHNTIDIKRIQINSSEFNIIENDTKGLYLLLAGKMKWQDCSNSFIIDDMDIILANQGSFAYQAISDECELIWVPLNNNFLREFLNLFSELLSQIKQISEPSTGIIKFTSNQLISESINSLKESLKNKLPEPLIKLRLEELLLILAFSNEGYQLMSILRQLSNRQAERLQSFMEKNYLKDWRLNEFAKEFGMGLTTFKELFGTVYGTSPRAWISERRILYAHQLLLNTQMSIVDISMEAGFSSQSYFTQSYRRRFGFTPSRTRHTS